MTKGASAGQVLICIPTYNERDNVEPIVRAVHEHLPSADVLIIDDASPDGTGRIADKMARNDERVAVLHRPGKAGLGKAYLAGFAYALERPYQYIFEMDADFSHNPEDLPRLLGEAEQGVDLVIGSRYVAGGGTANWGLVRKLISRGGSFYARTVLGLGIADLTSGFKCFRRRVLEALPLGKIRSEGYGFQIEMTYRTLRREEGFRVVEIPIVFVDRRVGQSKMSSAIVAEAMTGVWKLRMLPKGA